MSTVATWLTTTTLVLGKLAVPFRKRRLPGTAASLILEVRTVTTVVWCGLDVAFFWEKDGSRKKTISDGQMSGSFRWPLTIPPRYDSAYLPGR